MKIANIDKLAQMAKLTIPENEKNQLAQDLNKIFKLAEQMTQVDTSNVVPLAHPCDATQVLRQDIVTEHNERNQLQKCASNIMAGLYIVPAVIDLEG